jgi:predicted negative regulator of RcsB-dependent stress response
MDINYKEISMTSYNSPREKERVQALNRKIWLKSNASLLITGALLGLIVLTAFVIAGIMDTKALQQGIIQ